MIFSSRLVLATVILSFFTLSCSKPNEPNVSVTRGIANTTSITVKYASDADEADRVLVRKQGYVQAGDRLLQMLVLRCRSRGCLSQIFADKPAAEKQDRQVWAVGLPQSTELSRAKLQKLDPESFRLLEEYAKGVNDYLAELSAKEPHTLRLYRNWTRDPASLPEPWTPTDSIAIAEGMAFYLSSALEEKALVGSLAAIYALQWQKFLALLDFRAIEQEFIAKLPSSRNPSHPAPVASNQPVVGWTTNFHCSANSYPFPECGTRRGVMGSNNWVVSPKFSGNKKAFLASDPHLPLSYPTAFYEMALDSTPAGGSFKVRGMNLPGIPLILIGHNREIAWGLTNNPADVDDIYLEMTDDAGRTSQFKGKSVNIVTERKSLKVRQADGSLREKELLLRYVPHHGPIFSDHFPELQTQLDKLGQALAVKIVASYRWWATKEQQSLRQFWESIALVTLNPSKKALSFFRLGLRTLFTPIQREILVTTRTAIFRFENISHPEFHPISLSLVLGNMNGKRNFDLRFQSFIIRPKKES